MARGEGTIRKRTAAVAMLLILWAGAIGARLFWLQVVQSADFRDRAARQHERVLEISPRRGPIYDRNGNELAVSIEVESLYAVPSEVGDAAATAAFLSGILDIPAATLESRLDSERSFIWVQRKLSARQAERVREGHFDGLYFQSESRRFYPNRGLAAHVLGFVNIDDEGGSGLEYYYDDVIRGKGGRIAVMKDARGRSFHTLEQTPTSGASLTTTIDRNIQYIVESEVDRTIEETQAAGMSVVVMDPNNGEILAMANYPDFNPNEYGRFPQRNWRNRAIAQVYEPGSTFKVVTAAAALDEQLTTLEELIDCQMGAIVIHGHRIRDHKPFGVLSVKEVLKFSSDVGIIKLGMRLGDDRFASHIADMGFGSKTGIDLPGEERGLTKPADRWSRVSVGAISMGQEIGTTPLQIVNMIAAVANGGTLYRPFVVRRIDDPASGARKQARVSGRRVMTAGTARLLQEALESVVEDGTARSAQMPGYTAAGKTGTAQKIDPAIGTYSPTKHVASFAGYAPATRPEIAMVVAIDEPKGRYHGGEVAAPVFKRIAERVLRYRSVPPDAPESLPRFTDDGPPVRPSAPGPPAQPQPEPWEVVDASLPVVPALSAVSRPEGTRIATPDFLGQSLREVTGECLQLGLRCQSGGSGVAVAQNPSPGSPVVRGTRVQIRFSTSVGADFDGGRGAASRPRR